MRQTENPSRMAAMKGDPRIIEFLNEVLTSELTAINQYFIHYKMLENWGYKRLARVKRKESIEEMKHAEEIIDRILYLDGVPNMQRLGPVKVGEDPVEMHQLDLVLEQTAVERFNRGVALATQAADNGTRAILERLLCEEEEAIDWLEAQLTLIKDLGKENYLSQMIGEIE
jgi:bacterioferritin